MRSIIRNVAAAVGLALVLVGCQESLPVLDDLQDTSFELVNQDSAAVQFPQDYTGEVLVVGYIYTQCPDVCPRITANMKQVRNRLNTMSDTRFVSVTFDPRRDTPAKMASYRNAYNLGDTDWQFLTGDSTQVSSFMDRMGIFHEMAPPAGVDSLTALRENSYLVTHSNRISLVDKKGRVRQSYHGSRTEPEVIAQDVRALR